jgi:hypothetical protein
MVIFAVYFVEFNLSVHCLYGRTMVPVILLCFMFLRIVICGCV